jgi:ATPase subunit of ABC transporter with duplicated ATPase domains
VVSHDRALLDLMDRIAELDGSEVHVHGGNFTAYTQALAAAREVAEKNVRHAEQTVKREKRRCSRPGSVGPAGQQRGPQHR